MRVLVSALTVVAKQQLSARALLVLAWLAQQGSAVKMTELSQVCACSPAAITGIIDVLERVCFVERVYGDSQDRRAISIHLTGTGRAVITELAAQVEPQTQPEGLTA